MERFGRALDEVEVPDIRNRGNVAELLAVGERGNHALAKRGHARARLDRELDDVIARYPGGVRRPCAWQVRFARHDNPGTGRLLYDSSIGIDDRLSAVDDDDRERGHASCLMSPLDALDFDCVRRVAQPSGVHERDWDAADVDPLGQHVTRRAWDGGDNRARSARQRIEQTGLAGVRPPNDHDEPPLAQNPAFAPFTSEFHELRMNPAGVLARRLTRDEVKAFLRKIQRRFEPRRQIKQRRINPANRCRQRAFELIHGRASLQRRHRVHQIGHGFRLDEIDPAIEVRAQRELARLGQSRTSPHRELDDALEEHRTAVPADFHHVVACVGVRTLKPRDDDLINRARRRRGLALHDPRKRRVTWNKGLVATDEGRRNRRRVRSGQADDADAATAWGRRHRDDRVRHRERHAQYLPESREVGKPKKSGSGAVGPDVGPRTDSDLP